MRQQRKHLLLLRLTAEQGFSLLEAAVSLLVLATLAAVFLGSLDTTYRINLFSQETRYLDTLARDQIELIKAADYIDFSLPDHGDYETIAPLSGYDLDLVVTPIDPTTGQPLSSGQDNGMQLITVTVTGIRGNSISLQTYKTNR